MKFRLLERVNFRASTKTMWLEFARAHPRFKLADEDVVVFLSQGGDNLRFVYGVLELEDGTEVLRSREMRLMKGEWSVLHLKEYSRRVGMKITDWSVFEGAMKTAAKTLTSAVRKADLKAA